MKPPTSTGFFTSIVPLVTALRTEAYLSIPLGSEPLSVLATSPPTRALSATISASTYACLILPRQSSPAIPPRSQPLLPTPVSLPMKATFLRSPPVSPLFTIPAIPSLPRILPVTLTFSTVAFLITLDSAEIFSIQGILILTLPKLMLLIVPPSTLSNN